MKKLAMMAGKKGSRHQNGFGTNISTTIATVVVDGSAGYQHAAKQHFTNKTSGAGAR